MSLIDDLETIFIRAEVDGKWGSYSLAELPFEKVLEWFGSQLPTGHDDDAHKKAALVYALEAMGRTIYRVRKDANDEE